MTTGRIDGASDYPKFDGSNPSLGIHFADGLIETVLMSDEVLEKRGYLQGGTTAPWYSGWTLTDEERDRFRQISLESRTAKARALSGECDRPRHQIPTASFDPVLLMPAVAQTELRGLSLFSGGGGLDLGFEAAGISHMASYDILDHAGEVLTAGRPDWKVFSGNSGDVTSVNWSEYRNRVDILHGGPPCQPFSHAGRQLGASDARDMVPEFARAVLGAKPQAFVCENVAGLASKKFEGYLHDTLFAPLCDDYLIHQFTLSAADFGVPQRRRRVFFVGFKSVSAFQAFEVPCATHSDDDPARPNTLGARAALGLPDIGLDGLAPTIRSGLTGPRHTTSVVNSATAAKHWAALRIWPNGVAKDREAASRFPAKNGDYRMAIADCMLLQGFPQDWPISGPVYKALGLIGNSVSPPMGYVVAKAVSAALAKAA